MCCVCSWAANDIHRNFGILIGFILFFLAIYMLAAEYLSLDPSKGEILVFRRGHAPKTGKAADTDEESGQSSNSRAGDSVAKESGGSDHTAIESAVGLQKSDSIFHWRNVCYDITIKGEPRRILDHVDGWVKPGTLTALMVSEPLDLSWHSKNLTDSPSRVQLEPERPLS